MSKWFKHSRKTECAQVCELLSPYIDGELTPDKQRMVEAHIEACPICREELESLRKTASLVRSMPVVEPSRSFTVSDIPKRIWDGKLKALGTSTALVAIFLALVFTGDIYHFFDALALPSYPWTKPPETGEYYWPVRETEFALLGIFIALAVLTFIRWRRRARRLFRRK